MPLPGANGIVSGFGTVNHVVKFMPPESSSSSGPPSSVSSEIPSSSSSVSSTSSSSGGLSSSSSSSFGSLEFQFRINTALVGGGTSPVTQFLLPVVPGTPANFIVDWGDGFTDTVTGLAPATMLHTYVADSVYTVTMRGLFSWSFNVVTADKIKLIDIMKWEGFRFQNAYTYAFKGCTNLTSVTATDGPNFTGCTNIEGTFQGCSNLTLLPLGGWDTSGITRFANLFQSCVKFDSNIGLLNLSSAVSIDLMCDGCSVFNNFGSDSIRNWNTASLVSATAAFRGCSLFNQPLDNWNTQKLRFIGSMLAAASFNSPVFASTSGKLVDLTFTFTGAAAFNQPSVGLWNTSNVTDARACFGNCRAFNQPLPSWDLNKCVNASGFLRECHAFDQNIGHLGFAACTDMSAMFWNSPNFDNGGSDDIANWNTGNVTNMGLMFLQQLAIPPRFNRAVGAWNTSKVTNFSQVFAGCKLFNKYIGDWDVSSGANFSGMLTGCEAYNQPLTNWHFKTTGTINLANLLQLFAVSRPFNYSLNHLDVRRVTDFSNILAKSTGTDLYKQTIEDWEPLNITTGANAFSGENFQPDYFTSWLDNTFNKWSVLAIPSSKVFSFGPTLYSSLGKVARTYMSTVKLWTITSGANADIFTDSNSGGKLLLTSSHDIPTYTRVQMLVSGGALPGGLSTATDYWLVKISVNTYQVATSLANAIAGTTIAYTTAGSGTREMTILGFNAVASISPSSESSSSSSSPSSASSNSSSSSSPSSASSNSSSSSSPSSVGSDSSPSSVGSNSSDSSESSSSSSSASSESSESSSSSSSPSSESSSSPSSESSSSPSSESSSSSSSPSSESSNSSSSPSSDSSASSPSSVGSDSSDSSESSNSSSSASSESSNSSSSPSSDSSESSASSESSSSSSSASSESSSSSSSPSSASSESSPSSASSNSSSSPSSASSESSSSPSSASSESSPSSESSNSSSSPSSDSSASSPSSVGSDSSDSSESSNSSSSPSSESSNSSSSPSSASSASSESSSSSSSASSESSNSSSSPSSASSESSASSNSSSSPSSASSNSSSSPSSGSSNSSGSSSSSGDKFPLATSFTMVTGAVASGTIANTDVIDLSYLVLTEVSGTPGAEHIFDFYGAYSISPSIWNLKITGRYQGNPAHVNYFYYWNWSTSAWTRITANANDWPSSGTDATFQMAMPSNEALWISGGHVRILLVHASSGNPTHRYYYDQIVFA